MRAGSAVQTGTERGDAHEERGMQQTEEERGCKIIIFPIMHI